MQKACFGGTVALAGHCRRGGGAHRVSPLVPPHGVLTPSMNPAKLDRQSRGERYKIKSKGKS